MHHEEKPRVTSARFLTPAELSSRYQENIKVRTLANWRSQGDGPVFVKVGGKVMYRIEDVVAWESDRTTGKRK